MEKSNSLIIEKDQSFTMVNNSDTKHEYIIITYMKVKAKNLFGAMSDHYIKATKLCVHKVLN